jgi:carboxyl-terminal processing protease
MKAHHIYIPLLLGAALAAGIIIGKRLNFPSRPVALMNQELREQKFRQIINFIEYDYVDQVNTDSLLDLTITELLRKLDPHSTYITQSDVQRSEESIKGSFGGVGVEYIIPRDTLVVLRVLPGGPGEKAGLKGGDRIIGVDGRNVAGSGIPEADFASMLKGITGTKVKVERFRPLDGSTKEVVITRGKIPIASVDVAYMVTTDVGLIKINRFAETTYIEFQSALKRLTSKGMKNLILDLRDNPGGLLKSAINITDEFLDVDQLIVYTETRSGERNYTYATSKGKFEKGKLVVLINEGSASASEIIAGALQDNDRAIIAGRRSFGKGLVQEEMVLRDGSRVRLTTARYFTPTGRSIQKPYSEGYENYQKEALQRINNGELISSDSIRISEDQKFVTPGGKVVYGGGGIMPDVFIPIDTAGKALGWLYHYFGYNQLDRFAFNYVDQHRRELLGYTSENYRKNFQIGDDILKELFLYAELDMAPADLNEETRKILTVRLKGLIARNIWGDAGMYPILFQDDPMVFRALELFVTQDNPEVD